MVTGQKQKSAQWTCAVRIDARSVMKMRIVSVWCGIIIVLSSCSGTNHPKIFVSGEQKRAEVERTDWIVYTTPEMDQVKISRACYKTMEGSKETKERLFVDVYYPPEFNFEKKLPAVVLFSDHRNMIDESPCVSWAQLIAASGLVAVAYQGTVECEQDFVDLAHYLKKRNSFLRVNSRKIGVLASMAGIANFAATISTRNEDIPLQIRCAVCRSGRVPEPSEFQPDFPVLLLNAGQGHEGYRESVERFAAQAGELGIDCEILDYVEGVHKFDVRQDTPRSREIVRQAIAFYQRELF
jgi:hypothetical protein